MSGPLRLVPDEGTPGWAEETMLLRTLPRRRPRPASTPALPELSPDPLDDLAERLAELCADAVHPYEIAAFLESDGLTDEQAALVYGRADAFTLAEDLFAKVARRYPGPPPAATDPWRADPWRCVLRGLVFALPGLGYLLGAGLFAANRTRFGLPSGMAALAAATLLSWAFNQALAHRAYGWLSLADRRSAARTLAVGAPLGALLAAGAGWLIGGPLAALLFTIGQSAYLGAATVLLVLGQEKLLLAALTPSAAGAVLVRLVPLPGWAKAAILLATLAAAVGLAAQQLHRCLSGDGSGPAGPAWSATAASGLFGLAVGTLTMIAGLGPTLHHAVHPDAPPSPGANATGPALVALTLSLGLAEWLLYRYRSLATTALRISTSPGDFRRRTALVLLGCLLGYLLAVAALDYAGTALWAHAPLIGPTQLAALLLLAATLWTALLLQALSVAWRTAGLCLAAAGFESTVLLIGGDPTRVQLYGCGAAAALLVPLAVIVLGRTTRHR
ncbi:hypothetical protein OG455_20880 [Kitasatospora sp. NBC_01287]|uniref:hypothetical protein n=1 Tax=Kitasatospora sp. NBC_01287 TaxID=2903573 RepID=UPI00225360AD|nr:hypothetical protein [Kitasatospora sp. NBC_01287]MCX4747938.1 hypothetical protein [Kitasatospora sp. NBC_01287]